MSVSTTVLQSALPSSTLRNRLLLHLATRRKRAGHLSSGFTLVELMIVIVIVGILAAIAIPNFLTQTQKAKATEAKTQIATTLKQAQAQYIEDGLAPKTAIADMTTYYKAPANGTTKFDYTAAWDNTNKIYTLTATGNATDSDINTKVMKGCANFATGKVDVQSILDDPTAPDCT